MNDDAERREVMRRVYAGEDSPFRDGMLIDGVLENHIRGKIRRNRRKRTGADGSMTFRFSAYPHADRKLKPKQYEISVTTDMDGVGVDAMEEVAIADTALKLFDLRKRGAIFAGELGGLINNVDLDRVAWYMDEGTAEKMKSHAAERGMTVERYMEEVIWPMFQAYCPPCESPLPLPACADKILPTR